MAASDDKPQDLARRLAARRHEDRRASSLGRADDAWRRESFRLPRPDAREKAREFFARFPKAAYMSEIEWWRECENGEIEFTMRRLRSAD